MSDFSSINILVAEDNDVSRELISAILRTQGFQVYGAVDGESAIHVLQKQAIDLALVDLNMAPQGGFSFVRYLVARGNPLPVIIITGDTSSDILVEANALGVGCVLQKPVDPNRLLESVKRILKRHKLYPVSFAVREHETVYALDDIVQKLWELAIENVKSRKGGPFSAIVTDAGGRILGTGVSGLLTSADPVAHAEVMAIRMAAEKLGRVALGDCVLYCSSYPTRVGQAVITSVGIPKVYYNLSHEETGDVKKRLIPEAPVYEKIEHGPALGHFKQLQKEKP